MRHFHFSIIPYAWIGAYLVLYLAYAAKCATSQKIKLALSYLTSLPLCLIAGELYAYHASKSATTMPHAILGFHNVPNAATRARLLVDTQQIYDIAYTNDPLGNRLTPHNNLDSPRCINLYGGSFTYGNGVDDTQTLAAYLARNLPAWRVNNFGIGGAGAAQMLARLEFDLDKEALANCRENIFLYVAIAHHIYRALGVFLGPKYALDSQGIPVYQGVFKEEERARFLHEEERSFTIGEKLANQLEKSYIKKYFKGEGEDSHKLLALEAFKLGFASNIDIHLPEKETKLYFAIVEQIAREVSRKFGGRLVVLYWDYDMHAQFLEQYDALMESQLRRAGIAYVPVSAILGEEYKRDLERAKRGDLQHFTYRVSRWDTHPNAAANEQIAAFLSEQIKKGKLIADKIPTHPTPKEQK